MKYAILNTSNEVTNIVKATTDYAQTKGWIESTGANIGDTWDGEQFIAPEPLPYIPQLDVLSTDTWTIPADATTPATVTYTSEDTVYFSVNETTHAVEPVDYTATLEITADAPGPIRVEVKTQQLIITALEVTT
jgi:hypothetical protein